MAHFYASIQGNRSERTCLGTKSGILGHIRGWRLGGYVKLFYCPVIEDDGINIKITGGSNGRYDDEKSFSLYCRDHFTNELVEYQGYADKIKKAKTEFETKREKNAFRKEYKKHDFWKWLETVKK